jgi:hypothetical protein
MAISDYYVDPSIAADSGAGTSGDPYGDLQYALNQITRNATDGDRINVKAGTDEILSAALSLTTYGAPAFTAPLVFQGYTSSQGDGGVGGIDLNGNATITNAGSGICWYDMHLHNGPTTGFILTLTQYGVLARCELNDANAGGVTQASAYGLIEGCNFHDVGGDAIDVSQQSIRVLFNYIKQGASRTMTAAIDVNNQGCSAIGNIISIDSTSDGIVLDSSGAYAAIIGSNSILSSSGTGNGMELSSANNILAVSLTNNYIEGFSGAGGNGILASASSNGGGVYGKNALYNNTTNFTFNGDSHLSLGDNEALGGSGIAKSGSDTFANRFTYFAPVDTGNMQTGGYPQA